jgi:predicted amidohydrolase
MYRSHASRDQHENRVSAICAQAWRCRVCVCSHQLPQLSVKGILTRNSNNLNRADAILSRADPKDLDLLVLPELAFTGVFTPTSIARPIFLHNCPHHYSESEA